MTQGARNGEVDVARVRGWGNHHAKFLATLERHVDLLEAVPRTTDYVELTRGAPSREAALSRVGVRYAHDFLALNQRVLDAAGRLPGRAVRDPNDERALLVALADDSLALERQLVGALFAVVAEDGDVAGVFSSVGAAWDHEDLDVWAVAATPDDVPALNLACARLGREALRWAQPINFYLSERLARPGFAGTLDDYRALLERDPRNLVLATQVVQATYLAGDAALHEEVTARLRERYLPSDPPTVLHEGLLRGALLEIEALVAQPARPSLLDPKAELYRLARVLIACESLRRGILETSPWRALRRIGEAGGASALGLEVLGRAFDFGELLRYLFALLHAQDLPIDLDDPDTRVSLPAVAAAMGYGAGEEAVARLVRDYGAHRTALRALTPTLTSDLTSYLRSVSIIRRVLVGPSERAPRPTQERNVATALLREAESAATTFFWEDVVSLCRERPETLARWMDDLDRLPTRVRHEALVRYAELMQTDVARFLELQLLLRSGGPRRRGLADALLHHALALYDRDERPRTRFTDLLHLFPGLVGRFVAEVPPEATTRVLAVLRSHWSERLARKAGVRLLSLLALHHFSSRFSRNHTARVLARHPSAVTFLDDFGELHRLARSVLSRDAPTSTAARRQRLADFYDLEFLRLSLMLLAGIDGRRVGWEFRLASSHWVAGLFEVCVDEVAADMGRPPPRDHAGFALYATGGNAREDPFDVDYDSFAVLTDEAAAEPERRRFYNRCLARLTRALAERGIQPNNRFADRFGAYVASIGELRAFFSDRDVESPFIERTELLGARIIAGDPAVDPILDAQVLAPHVFGCEGYPAELVAELRARRASAGPSLDLKEAPGGLRDVQLLLAHLCAKLRLRSPESARLWATLRARCPELGAELTLIEHGTTRLKRVRDVYRLTVVGEDVLEPSALGIVAVFTGHLEAGEPSGAALLRDCEEIMRENVAAIDRALLAFDARGGRREGPG